MRLHGHKNKSLIISILLMTVCVQSFSMHFHSAEGDDEHGSHAHVLGSMYADHLTTEHEGEAGPGFLETLVKQLPSLDLFVLVLLDLGVLGLELGGVGPQPLFGAPTLLDLALEPVVERSVLQRDRRLGDEPIRVLDQLGAGRARTERRSSNAVVDGHLPPLLRPLQVVVVVVLEYASSSSRASSIAEANIASTNSSATPKSLTTPSAGRCCSTSPRMPARSSAKCGTRGRSIPLRTASSSTLSTVDRRALLLK